jgi:hypothetical protein
VNHFSQAPKNNIRVITHFELFWKIVDILASQGAPLVSMTPVVNFATGTVVVVDTGGK